MSSTHDIVDSAPAALFLLSLQSTITSSPFVACIVLLLVYLYFHPGGPAWAISRALRALSGKAATSSSPAPAGPPGFNTALASPVAHQLLAKAASQSPGTNKLMAFSTGLTRFVVASDPETARDILQGNAFTDRPVKESAYELLFDRAMGFAPHGEYWRGLRRVSATHMFSPRMVAASGARRAAIGLDMVRNVAEAMGKRGAVQLRHILHCGSLNSVMGSVFGKGYESFEGGEGAELERMVLEGYELLGTLNWGDHLPLTRWMDLQGVRRRSRKLIAEVEVFVGRIIDEHRMKKENAGGVSSEDDGDRTFVDVLLEVQNECGMSHTDMVAVLWEMIFRGTDTVSLMLEWALAEMVLHPDIQAKAQSEIDSVVGNSAVTDADIARLPYLHSIVKETLRVHPPGPLLSWARLAVQDAQVGDYFVPAGTTAMVNMYAITHDPTIWKEPEEFKPERFTADGGNVSLMGTDLTLAPFGSGKRVCPGKSLGLATAHLWLAQLLQNYNWVAAPGNDPVDLTECLKMSMEMKTPLVCKAVPRAPVAASS